MPLLGSPTKKAFSRNVKEEMKSGKPQKQALAIAYSKKRKAKRTASGRAQGANDSKKYLLA